MLASLLLLQAPAGGGNPLFATVAMYAVIAAIFYFVLFRPQQAQRKAHDAAVKAIKRGDAVVTAGGIVGEVVNVREQTAGTPSPDDHVTIRSGESRLVVERGRIAKIGTVRAVAGTAASGSGAA
jgi:preprotein translocase subunit YajC